MGTAIKVPTITGAAKLSVGRWFKRVGDPVSIDEPLVEIDTDNLTHEIPSARHRRSCQSLREGRRICRTRHSGRHD
jgi:hypothetical protein